MHFEGVTLTNEVLSQTSDPNSAYLGKLQRPHCEMGSSLIREIIPACPFFRLLKYYDLPRYVVYHHISHRRRYQKTIDPRACCHGASFHIQIDPKGGPLTSPGGRYVKKEDLDGPHQKTLGNWKTTYGRLSLIARLAENQGRKVLG